MHLQLNVRPIYTDKKGGDAAKGIDSSLTLCLLTGQSPRTKRYPRACLDKGNHLRTSK